MYPMCTPPYPIPTLGHMNGTASLPSYPRLTSRTCSNQQVGHQTSFLPPNPRFPPLHNRTTLAPYFPGSPSISATGLPSTFTTMSKDAFYSIPHPHSSTVDTDLDSPVDRSSPESLHMHSDTHSSTKDPQLNTFGYPASPKSASSLVNLTMNTNTSCSPMYTPPILPVGPTNPMYSYNCPEYTSSLPGGMSPLSTLPGWSAYPSLPSSSGPVSHSNSVPKLSYDSPRYKLTPERAIPLIKWFEEHKDHPYPTRHEKMLLCQSTQLTFTQVSTWFANARRRMKKASLEEGELANGTNSDCSDSPKSSDDSSVVVTETYSMTATTSEQDSQEEQSVKGQERERTNLWTTIY